MLLGRAPFGTAVVKPVELGGVSPPFTRFILIPDCLHQEYVSFCR